MQHVHGNAEELTDKQLADLYVELRRVAYQRKLPEKHLEALAWEWTDDEE